MPIDAPERSIVSRDSPRLDLLVFEIQSKIPKADIEWMSRIVDRAFEEHEQIDMLLLMTNYEGSELSAMLDGEALSVQSRSVARVRRYAVVGAPSWARTMIEIFGSLSPVDAKTFELANEAAAWAWVDQRP
ncbi:STAS/SEC14 domain-containing protein [Chenggangzhangella methanolivorans]|uniref:STAS/SEC14 domain-containing protein n=1 Tax=Chenggangzhangella methanolivorans TaxID=1437009 RepID=A0A9E6UKB0_9HYPH|nr:STAS/SEC14 domain-containing protein [Chenggangzhangella methanolivorans]QZN99071.1 STAS/SEC14 domain-containing protein [Chenggangzhangella methanolivorans]